MKKILIQFPYPEFANNAVFKNKDINNGHVRWFELKRRLFDMGFELTTADDNNLIDCEGIIFLNVTSLAAPFSLKNKFKNIFRRLFGIKIPSIYPNRKLYEEGISAGLKDKMILIAWEPKSVCQLNYSASTFKKFNRILTWDDDLLNNPKFIKFYIPMESDEITPNNIPFEQKKLLTNISFNKYSSYRNELYSARRKTIAYFDVHYPNDFDLYGVRWNQPITRWQLMFPGLVKKYSTYRGHTMKKIDTLSRYKFNLCYENTSDAKGYIADRIFSSFYAKAVPIYWGATNINQYVDANTFVDRRQFKSEAELAKFLTQMTEAEYNKYIDAAARYMQSEKFSKFLPENFCDIIINALNLNK